MILIPYLWVKLFKEILLFNHNIFLTLEPGSQLSEELWHPIQKETQYHFHVGLRPRYTWSSPLPGVSSLKLEDLHLSGKEVQGYLLLLGFLLNSPTHWGIRFKFVHCNPISSLDHRDVYFTSNKKSKSGLIAFEVIIINSDKSHTPEGLAGSGQIIKALTVTVVMFPSLVLNLFAQ